MTKGFSVSLTRSASKAHTYGLQRRSVHLRPVSVPFRRELPFRNSRVFLARAKGRGRSSNKDPGDDKEETEGKPKEEKTPQEPVAKSSIPESTPSVAQEGAGSQGQTEAVDESEAIGPWKEDRPADIRSLKASLLSAVAGFDRGLAAVPKDVAMIRNIVESLETLSGSIDLTAEAITGPSSQELFKGTWKLIFTSAFRAGRRRPLPFIAPFTLGPVYQVVDTQKRELDNILELLATNAPRFPWTPSNAVPKLRLTLNYEMSYSMSIVSLTFKNTTASVLDSGFEIPNFTLPSLQPLVRSFTSRKSDGEFSLVYLDEDLRITEGERSELRIFVKIPDLE